MKWLRFSASLVFCFLFLIQPDSGLFGQPIDRLRLDRITDKYVRDSFEELTQFLSIPNDAHFPEHVRKNLEWVECTFEKRNFETTVLHTEGCPLLLASRPDEDAVKTVLIYLKIDGQRHISNQPSLTFGARGIATITLTVFGPKVPQHSGHYGNYAPNPAFRLARLLSSMKDRDGRVIIPGFYEGIELDRKTLDILAQVPDDENEIMRKLGIAEPDQVGRTYQEAIQYPSINVRGMASGWIGDEVRTIIPSTATAEIDVRLVPETEPERLIRLIKTHIEDQEYTLVEGQPTDEERSKYPRIASFNHEISYGAFRTPFDSEVGIWLKKAMMRAFDKEPIRKRMSGGSIPISPFINILKIPAVTVPTVNSDNNQHSPNENLRVGNYVEGVKTFVAILTQPF